MTAVPIKHDRQKFRLIFDIRLINILNSGAIRYKNKQTRPVNTEIATIIYKSKSAKDCCGSKLIKEIQYIEIQAATNMALICLIKTRIYLQREFQYNPE